MKNIFDLNNIEDLPKDVQQGICKRSPTKFELEIKELFELAKTPLTIDELTVGYYRKYKKALTKIKMRNRLYQHAQSKICCFEKVKGKRTTYRLKVEKC